MKFMTRPTAFLLIGPLFLALIFCLMPDKANATIVVRLNILELTTKSNKIIEGTITSVKSVVRSRNMVYTEVKMNVSETIRGIHSDTAVFKVPGGMRSDGLRLSVAGAPKFNVGEKVIVFLEGKNGDIVTGFSQGRFGIEYVDGEAFATQNTKGLCMLDAKGPVAGEAGGPVTDWPQKFTSVQIKSTSLLKASQNEGTNGEFIHGSVLQVPLKLFKATVKECNPDNYPVTDR
jgi:hypothetical protein